jgi:hypothetical protein
MKSVIPLVVLAACTSAPAQETNSLLMYYRSSRPLTLIDASKVSDVTNGITFKQIIDDLGPGWRPPTEGIGLVSWTFNDGRKLDVQIPHFTMVNGRGTRTPLVAAHFHWWTNAPTETSTDTNLQPKFLRY